MAKTITLLCPNLVCRAMLTVPDKVRGKKIRCGKCGTHFVVPGSAAIKAGSPEAASTQATAPGGGETPTV